MSDRPLTYRLSRPVGPADLAELAPLFPPDQPPSLELWGELRPALGAAWEALLGAPPSVDFDPTPERVDTFEQPGYRGTAYRQPTSPTSRQLVWILEPDEPAADPRPAALVPFYHPHWSLGYDPETGETLTERPTIRFAKHLLAQGYVVACSEAFPFNTVPEPERNVGFAWWQAAADQLLADHPDWSGMGKLVWDARLALDLLLDQPRLDLARVAAMGHSLGGKIVFYTAALDERIRAAVSSDFGIGWGSTNWHNQWYFGERIQQPGFALAHHQLLALMAPRPFLLIAGDVDGVESAPYLEAAREVYRQSGASEAIGCFDHDTGHTPTSEAMQLAYGWLAEQFGLPRRDPGLPEA